MSHELLLHGDRLLVLSRGGYWVEPLPAMAARIAPVSARAVRARRGRRLRSEAAAPRPHADARRLVRRRAARRRQRADRRRGAGARRRCRSCSRKDDAKDGARRRDRAQPRRRRLVARRELAPDLPDQARRREGRARRARSSSAATSAGRRRSPGLGHADRADGRPREGARARRLGRGDDRRPDRLRLAREPLRRDRALGRPPDARQADSRPSSGVTTAIHKFDISSPARTQYRGSGQVSGYLLSQWSLSEHRGVLRVVSTGVAGLVGRGPARPSRS